jgi:hypothetical protein
MTCAIAQLDHLIGAGENVRRQGELDRLRSDQVDDEIEFGMPQVRAGIDTLLTPRSHEHVGTTSEGIYCLREGRRFRTHKSRAVDCHSSRRD